jgi:hypothetical protein
MLDVCFGDWLLTLHREGSSHYRGSPKLFIHSFERNQLTPQLKD